VLHHAAAGRHLHEVALSAGSDTADLLGGFEQLEPARAAQVLGTIMQTFALQAGEFGMCVCLPEIQHVDASGFQLSLCQTCLRWREAGDLHGQQSWCGSDAAGYEVAADWQTLCPGAGGSSPQQASGCCCSTADWQPAESPACS
jgi:hypothetical protein